MTSSLQSWNQLKNRESKDDEVSWRVWKVVETKVGKVRVEKTKEERKKREREEKGRTKRTEKEKTKEGGNNGSKEGNRGMVNFGWRRSSEVRERDKMASTRKIS